MLHACEQARLGVSEGESPGDLVVKRRKQAVTCFSIYSITLSGNTMPKTERNRFLKYSLIFRLDTTTFDFQVKLFNHGISNIKLKNTSPVIQGQVI